jgi:serine phosphatase RsbU (regulator of sigma subunit)
MVPRPLPLAVGLLWIVSTAVPCHIAAQSKARTGAGAQPFPVLRIDELGKGTAPIDGSWQFHLGDDPRWALPGTPDATGTGGWEQITAGQPWGAQGHQSYAGYGWYRKHLSLSPSQGIGPNLYLLIPHIDNVYEVYWNGRMVGHNGTMPPDASFPYGQSAQIVNLGPARDGVLAIRVWKKPLASFDTGLQGGFAAMPKVGSLDVVTSEKAALDYSWLRGRQYTFGLQLLYAVLTILSLLAWLRNRSQRVLLAMALFAGSPVIVTFLVGLRLPIPYNIALGWLQPVLGLHDIGLWFLMLYLLELDSNPRFTRLTRNLAILNLIATSADGLLAMFDWSRPWLSGWVQWADAFLTAIFTIVQAYPLVLVIAAVRKRLDSPRWILAITAFLAEMLSVVRVALSQGSRFTHWTIGDKISTPAFYINGNGFTPQTIADTALLAAIIYAVYRYMQRTARRQGALEQELKSARELQQVLIPETLPELPGYAMTSAYRPAQEVGGDFFQIIPLEGHDAGSTLIVLGDVSGKGLRAAMAVSLIVGAIRTLARFAPRPAELLAELNQRLCGRLQGGFTTCLALRLDPGGRCTIASAGHPAPFLNQREIQLPGALPLGVVPGQLYSERELHVHEGDHFALFTDGLLEARNASGEIFSFERLNQLLATRPDATVASDAAVEFGQDDDITVLTLTRLGSGEQSTTQFTAPALARA